MIESSTPTETTETPISLNINEDVLSDAKTHPFGSLSHIGIKALQQCSQDLIDCFPILTNYPLVDAITNRPTTSIVSTNYNRTQV